jgi:2'-5' RNA ligase
MDVADAPASEGVMIALLPITADWCKQDLPHLTLVYAGTVSQMKPTDFNNLAKDAASLAQLASPFFLRVVAMEKFGTPGDEVDALRLMPTTELWAMRRFVEDWNQSEHSFNPHVTIGPAGSGASLDVVPQAIGFNQIYVGWGDDGLAFNLTRGSSSSY